MRERIINIVIILVVLVLGVTGTLYFVNNDSNNNGVLENRNVNISNNN